MKFMTLKQLRREAERIGLSYEETVEMTYENALAYIRCLQKDNKRLMKNLTPNRTTEEM